MIEYGDPETWGMTVDQFLDASNEQLGTSDIIMDSKYQVKGLNTMPSVQPPINKVMPSFEGLEDPKQIENYQQIELADGGVVEREGLNKGIKKLETIINNIGQEKIKAGKLNKNEFNILRKAVNSSSAQTAIKYGGKALKVLGPVLAPIIAYDTYDQYKKGKPLAEIIEYGLIGTSGSREARKMANYTPEEREAIQQAQQYERNEEDISGLSSDFDTPTNLSADQISELATTGSKRVKDLMLAQDEAKAKQRVYTGAPEIEDYGEDIEVDERVGLSVGSIPKGVSWVARRIQDINKLIKSKKAGPEDFLDEIQLLEKAEELNLTEGQVNQILKQQQQQRMDNYRKLPIQGEPAAKSRLPIDDIMSNYATGGRVGLKLGTPKKLYDLGKKILKNKEPENPDRRDFLKGAGALGLAITAFGTGALKIAKALKTKTALKVLAEPAVGQPAWFAPLVDKILLKGSMKKIDDFAKNVDPSKPVQFEERSVYAKDYPNRPVATYGLKPILEKSTAEKLGNVTRDLNVYELEEAGKKFTLTKKPGGSISIDVEGGGAYDNSFTLSHKRYNVQDIETGKIKEIREFQASEMRPEYVNMGGDEHGLDYALEATKDEVFIGKDVFKLEKNGTGFLSDLEGVEKIATGKIKNPKLAETRTKVRNKLNDDPYKDRTIDNYDYQFDQEIGHDYTD